MPPVGNLNPRQTGNIRITFELDEESAALLWWDVWCDEKRSATDIVKDMVELKAARVRQLHNSEADAALDRFKSDYTPTPDEAG